MASTGIGRIGSVAEWNDLLNTADKNKSGIVAQFTAVVRVMLCMLQVSRKYCTITRHIW